MRHTFDHSPEFERSAESQSSQGLGARGVVATGGSGAEQSGSGSRFTPPVDGTRSLRELVPGCRVIGADDVRFTSIAESPQSIERGQLVAYRVGETDPVRLVADALACGAAGIVTEQLLPCPLPQCMVGDVDATMAILWSEILHHPDHKVFSIGVIGSAGKSTTTLMIANLLRRMGVRTAYQTDLGECDGVVQSTPAESMPTSDALVRWFGDAADCDAQATVIELSDQDVRHGRYDAVRFDVLVVTGSATSNGDFGPSSLQCAIERMTSDGVVVVPADDRRAERAVRDSGVMTVTYGIRCRADVSLKSIDQSGGMNTLMISHRDTSAMMETPLCGTAMAANHAAAAAVGVLIDQPLASIAETLGSLRTVPGRDESMPALDQADVTIDAAGTPQRAALALRSARAQRQGGRVWCVLAIGADETSDELARYGELLERYGDHAIVTSNRSVKQQFLHLSHHVLDGVQKCAAMRLVADHQRAVRWAVAQAQPRDRILVLGGVDRGSAHAHRSHLAEIRGWVESERRVQADREDKAVYPEAPATHGFRVVG